MWCGPQFASFDNRLKLDAARRGRIDSALSHFVAFCQQDDQLKAGVAEAPFLQGSVGTGTAIRPLAGDEFDVDVVYPFGLLAFKEEHRRPTPIFNWFVGRLERDGYYRERLIRKNRCVRVDYAGDFHVDIIPATTEATGHQPYAVPAMDLSDWTTNDPKGFAHWLKQRDARSGLVDGAGDGVLVRCVRYMKRWRDQFFGEGNPIASLLLTTVLGKHEASSKSYNPPLENPLYPQYSADAAYLYDLARLTHSCLLQPTRPANALRHPTLSNENLARDLSEQDLSLFLKRLDSFIGHLRAAIWAQNSSEAIASYRKAFGDTFPSE
jgi:hypothetical protein